MRRNYVNEGVLTNKRPTHSREPFIREKKPQIIERLIYRESQKIDSAEVANLIKESMADDVRRAAVKAFIDLLKQFKNQLPTASVPSTIPIKSTEVRRREVRIDDSDLKVKRDTGLTLGSPTLGETKQVAGTDALQNLKNIGVK